MTGNEDLGKWKEKVPDDLGIPMDTKGQSLKGIIEIVRKTRTQVPVPNGIPHKVYKM